MHPHEFSCQCANLFLDRLLVPRFAVNQRFVLARVVLIPMLHLAEVEPVGEQITHPLTRPPARPGPAAGRVPGPVEDPSDIVVTVLAGGIALKGRAESSPGPDLGSGHLVWSRYLCVRV